MCISNARTCHQNFWKSPSVCITCFFNCCHLKYSFSWICMSEISKKKMLVISFMFFLRLFFIPTLKLFKLLTDHSLYAILCMIPSFLYLFEVSTESLVSRKFKFMKYQDAFIFILNSAWIKAFFYHAFQSQLRTLYFKCFFKFCQVEIPPVYLMYLKNLWDTYFTLSNCVGRALG